MGVFLARRLPASVVRTAVLLFCLLIESLPIALVACGGGTAGLTGGGATGTTSAGIQGKQVIFKTEDGMVLSGHLFGSGTSGVVLSHMYPADQKSWYATAKKLAAMGYLVLTYDFRGYGLSGGNKQIEYIDRDVYAAVKKITAAGASRVVLIGASMGGTASLKAAERLFKEQLQSSSSGRITVAGVATLSAPVVFQGLSAENTIPRLGEKSNRPRRSNACPATRVISRSLPAPITAPIC